MYLVTRRKATHKFDADTETENGCNATMFHRWSEFNPEKKRAQHKLAKPNQEKGSFL